MKNTTRNFLMDEARAALRRSEQAMEMAKRISSSQLTLFEGAGPHPERARLENNAHRELELAEDLTRLALND